MGEGEGDGGYVIYFSVNWIVEYNLIPSFVFNSLFGILIHCEKGAKKEVILGG